MIEREGTESAERPLPGLAAGGRAAGRRIVYCLVPAELAEKLHEPLRSHFRDDPGVEVVVERRRTERRSSAERRTAKQGPPGGTERRRTRGPNGRRVEERRAALTPVGEPPPLPRRARRYSDRIGFVERIEPSAQKLEDLDTARVVARFQAGDTEAFSILYSRYYDRVYAYLRVALRDPHDAEDATQNVFLKVLEALPRYERRRQPFRHWLFTSVRNHALDQLAKQGRVEPVSPQEMQERLAGEEAPEPEEISVLDWLSDRDLQVFVSRLSPLQRQVLTLRYLLGFKTADIARLVDREPNAVSAIQHRALAQLEERLRAIGRAPVRDSAKRDERSRSERWVKQATVLRSRRFSLM